MEEVIFTNNKTIEELKKENELLKRENEELKKRLEHLENELTKNHLLLLCDLKIKKGGNIATYANRPVLKRNEWNDMLINMISDADEHSVGLDLLNLLEKYNKVSSSEDWIIKGP